MATSHRTLIWRADRRLYELDEQGKEQFFPLAGDEEQWVTWLESISAFSFQGQQGQLTVRKEARPRGEQYWYAYRRVGSRMMKKYLGRSTTLTLARLEEIAAAFPPAAPSSLPGNEQRMPQEEAGRDDQATGEAETSPLLLAQARLPGDPLLTTKLHQPYPRNRLVSRSYLIERLQQGMTGALTLLSAPAGYGKTTLLTQWLAERNMPVSWLSLEPEDNDPVRFLTYLLAALQVHDPDLDMHILALLQARPSTPLQKALAVLTNDLLNRQGGDFALVLDDYQVIDAAPIHHALSFLLDHLPPQMHLVLATRADPPLPLARLRARGQLTELRTADFQLSSSESETFLQAVMGLDLPSEAMLALERRTEGWVAGLQLAALSLRGRDDVSTFLAAFTGSHRFVLDYLSEEVLSRQPASVLLFLLHTCILERLCGSLCDAVTEQEDSQAMLETLERANLFVVPLDEERRWYRYHHLFAELLQSRLQQTQPALLAPLHRRASLWYEQHDQPMEAVHHTLAAHDVEHAARLIERYAAMEFAQGRTRLLLEWLNALPEALRRAHSWLCLYHAAALHLSNQLEEAEVRLQESERALGAMPSVEQASILGWALSIRANLARYCGDLEYALTLADQALVLLPETQVMMRATTMVMVVHTYLVNGDVTANTEQQVRAAVAAALASGYRLVHFRSLTLLARLQMLQGRLREASATYEQAGQATPGEVLQVLSASAVYCFALGDLLCEWNRLDEAERLLGQGMEQIRGKRSVYGDDLLLGSLTLVRLHLARGAHSPALALLDAFMHLAETRHFPLSLKALGDVVRAQIALAQDKLSAAVSWADASGLSCDDAEVFYPREREYLTLVRVRLTQGRADPAGPWLQEMLPLLDRLRKEAKAKARVRSMLEILILQALTLDAQSKRDEALSTLHDALKRAEPEGYIRLFADEGPPMQILLQKIQARGLLPGYVTRLLSAFGDPHVLDAAPDDSPNQALVESLTRREREVLHLLSAGASNREIARRLVLSLGTVKKHVSNICGKLDAQSRTQAVAHARALHLL
ncbi:MAG TPA: LuxR C-terminal-related transcriptional regulator [Ktedonobacteraceae bacterium]|nr:LuxR C-terminal-related transcriptional regulator [Ktedonobacteraceae bacterium]